MRTTAGRIAAVLLTLALIAFGIIPPRAQALTITPATPSGTPTTLLGVSGTGTSGESVTINFDSTFMTTTTVLSGGTTWSATITIPHVAGGPHTISATGSLSGSATTPFNVTAGITPTLTSGTVGATVTINGIGFGNQETGIKVQWDNVSVAPDTTSTNLGDFTTTFAVPTSTYGSHAIIAFGSLTPTPRTINFQVLPTVSLDKSSGAPNSTIQVKGTGFAANETGITVTYDGMVIGSTTVTANSQGVWSTPITIPASPAGSHVFHAYGSTTLSAATQDVAFTVGAGITSTDATGAAGKTVTVGGSGFGTSETGITVTFDGTTVASGVRASDRGAWTATFNVPNAPAGSHTIGAYGSSTASVSGLNFTVTPTLAAGKATGTPGAQVTVTGTGFGASESNISILWDGNPIATTIRANAQGGWSGTFAVPATVAGPHSITASGALTQPTAAPEVIFTVSAGIMPNPTSGAAGTQVTVTGAGFAANETGITVTFDGTNVAAGLRATAQGGFTGTFNVPNAAGGDHNIHAYGATTPASATSDVVFRISPGLSVSQTSGAPGSSVTVTGGGFGPNETGITVTYDSTTVASGLRASAQGAWTTSFVVPPSPAGSHSIAAAGSVTQTATVTPASFSTAPTANLNPVLGYVGSTVQVSAAGFGINSPVKVFYDDKDVTPTPAPSTDTTGSVTVPLTIPKSKSGAHTIRLADALKNEMKATFTIDTTPPPVPAPQSPDDASTIGFVGSTMPAFRWAAVTSPNGVFYEFQIDVSPDFSQPIVNKTDLANSRYTLTAAEALPLGSYYWRVRAIDQAGNISPWSQPRVLKSGVMSMTTLILIIVLVVAALGAAAWFFLIRRVAVRRREAVALGEEGPRVVVTPGQWRSIEGPSSEDQPPRERPMPLRLALPTPVKGQKTLSNEEQARLKVIVDFAQSLPLTEAGYTTSWLLELLESGTGIEASLPIYEQLLKGDLEVKYEPAWIHHPTYQDLTSLLEGQPILNDLNAFVDAVNRCASDGTSLLQDIYKDSVTEMPQGLLERGGWQFVSAVYNDVSSWFMGKSLRDPSERDYSIKPRAGDDSGSVWLHGEDITTFAGPLIQAADEREATKLRNLHLKLRRNYRSNSKAKDVVGMMTQLEVQRSRLLNLFSQFGRLKQ